MLQRGEWNILRYAVGVVECTGEEGTSKRKNKMNRFYIGMESFSMGKEECARVGGVGD